MSRISSTDRSVGVGSQLWMMRCLLLERRGKPSHGDMEIYYYFGYTLSTSYSAQFRKLVVHGPDVFNY